MSRISCLKGSFPLTNAFNNISRYRYGSHVCYHSCLKIRQRPYNCIDDGRPFLVALIALPNNPNSRVFFVSSLFAHSWHPCIAGHVYPIQVLEQDQIITRRSSLLSGNVVLSGSSKPHSQRVFIRHVCCPSSSCSRHPALDSRKRAELY